jgi:hypothetical protein
MGRNSRLLLSALLVIATTLPSAAVASTTVLTLGPSPAGPPAMTLTARVLPLTTGTVTFCDNASAPPSCPDAAVVGKAQLTVSEAGTLTGTAALTIIPATGSHSYYAIFSGTATETGSLSNIIPVPGLYPTTTTIAYSGGPSGYGLTATVTGFASQPPVLAGSVTFQDTTNNNNLLGIVPLGPTAFAQTFTAPLGSPVPAGNSPSIAGVGDFNEDGIPDLAIENAGDNTISILLGNGKGGFAPFAQQPPIIIGLPPCEIITLQSNCAIVVGDFDDDGHADLALTSPNDGTVVILKGNGKGSFAAFGSPIKVGSFP